MTRLWARSLSGERVVDNVPHGHWMTMTFIAALRVNVLNGREKRGDHVERLTDGYIKQLMSANDLPDGADHLSTLL